MRHTSSFADTLSPVFQVATTAGANTAPTAANNTVTIGSDTTYTFKADDFRFADTDTGDTLASVKIVSLPAAGTGVALAGTTVSLNDVIPSADIGGLTFTPAPAEAATAMRASPSRSTTARTSAPSPTR